jgi:hypothetical protein
VTERVETCLTVSQPKLTMGAKAHKFEAAVIRFAVDENEIRLMWQSR